MKYLWDTDTCIYFFNGEEPVRQRLLQVGAENITISCITIAELRYGAHKSSRVKENLNRIASLKQHLGHLDIIDDAIADRFGYVKSHLKSQGITVGDFDLLIGCFAIENDMILVTNNAAHFSHIPDLKIENWLNS